MVVIHSLLNRGAAPSMHSLGTTSLEEVSTIQRDPCLVIGCVSSTITVLVAFCIDVTKLKWSKKYYYTANLPQQKI